jgi:hypothetical protein
MRLWSQARLMGCQAAAAMSGALETELQPFSFELVSAGRQQDKHTQYLKATPVGFGAAPQVLQPAALSWCIWGSTMQQEAVATAEQRNCRTDICTFAVSNEANRTVQSGGLQQIT